MTLIIKSGGPALFHEWQAAFQHWMPELTIAEWNDTTLDPAEVRYALVWQPDPGRLASFPNLEMIFSAAAGVDHLHADPQLPTHCPIIRMVIPETQQAMAEYVLMGILMLTRHQQQFFRQQLQHQWKPVDTSPIAQHRRIGILGLGSIGIHVAQFLTQAGFFCSGWSRTAKDIPSVQTLSGTAGLRTLLAGADVLINLLPDVADTRDLLNDTTLKCLPQGASLINAGRGPQLNTEDLLTLLNQHHIANAMLDVFSIEPLASSSPLWDHPDIIITPHSASSPSRMARARFVADYLRQQS